MLKERKPFGPNVALRHAREEKGWSQQQVATLLGTNTFTVCRWEGGSVFPSPHYRQKLCKLFDRLPRELGLLPQSAHSFDDTATIQHVHLNPILREKPVYVGVHPPDHSLIGRESLLRTLKTKLCTHKRTTITALCGLPGVGKTALALELIHDDDVRTRFPDGIVWAHLGQSPDILSLLGTWAQALGLDWSDRSTLNTVPALRQALTALIGERRLLFVIDDAWDFQTAQTFKVGGWRCSYLLTTRLPSLALQFAHQGVLQVPVLEQDEGVRLLEQFVPSLIAQAKEQVAELVQAVDGLPLALILIGHYLQAQAFSGHPRRIQKALTNLREATMRLALAEPYTSVGDPVSTPFRSLQTAIAPSIQVLGQKTQMLLRKLAFLFSQCGAFSEAAAQAACGLSEAVLMEQLDMLLDTGLLASNAAGHYIFHPTIADYLRLLPFDALPKDPFTCMAYHI